MTTTHISDRRYFGGRWYDQSTTVVRQQNYVARISNLGVAHPTESPYAKSKHAWYYGEWSYGHQYGNSRVKFTIQNVEAPF